jgi:hypothetical protein
MSIFDKVLKDAMNLMKKHEKETQAIILALALAAASAGVAIAESEEVKENAAG